MIQSMLAKDTNTENLIKLMVGRDINQQFPKIVAAKKEELLRIEDFTSEDGSFKDISFSVCGGEVLGFAGLVGAGRTEVMRAIFGADARKTGKVYVKGKEADIRSPKAAISYGIAFLTEDRKGEGLVLSNTVGFNINLSTFEKSKRGLLLNNALLRNKAKNDITQLRIKTPSINTTVRGLSGGNQQKVVIAKWLETNADIFIMDEPTRGLDVGAKLEVYNIINNLVSEGKAVIMVSSELPEVMGMSDRIIVMHEGYMAGEFKRDEVERVLAGLLLLCILFSVTTPSFLQMKNVMNVLNQASVNCLLSMGVLLAVLTGGNDLSTGANLALSSMIVAISIKFWGLNPFVGLLLGLAVGAFIGVLNGFMLTKMHMPHPFISTLGMQNVARGLALIVTGAAPVSSFPKSVQFLGNSMVGVVPMSIIFVAIVAVVFYIFLNRTAIGKHIYAIGGNAEAAKLSGINIDKTIIIVYTICGFMAALGGIVQMGRVDSAFPLAGTGYELNAVASVVIGGASMKGGSGTVSGTIIGAMVIAVLNNGLNLLHVSTYAQQIALGIVIIGAVYVDVLRERLGSKAKKN